MNRLPTHHAAPLLAVLLASAALLLSTGSAGASPATASPATASPATAAPVRVATLLPYVADALRGLPPSRVRVVAIARRTVEETPPAGVADLGSAHSPNLERLAGSGAQLLVGDDRLHKALQPKVEAAGVEALMVRGDSVDGTLEGLERVARRVGVEREMAARIAETRAAIAAQVLRRPVSTLVLFGAPGSFMVVTPQTWLGDLIAHLGMKNLGTAGVGNPNMPGYLSINDEVMASLSPDLVLVVTHGDPRQTEEAFHRMVRERAPWKGLAAARYGIHVLDPALFAANPGLRLGDAARSLAALAADPRAH
jgi:ABC-type Fe3+-hydroxamate transport system substrate-binding protein